MMTSRRWCGGCAAAATARTKSRCALPAPAPAALPAPAPAAPLPCCVASVERFMAALPRGHAPVAARLSSCPPRHLKRWPSRCTCRQATRRLDELCYFCELHPAVHASGAVAALTALLRCKAATAGTVAAAASALNRLAWLTPDVQVPGGCGRALPASSAWAASAVRCCLWARQPCRRRPNSRLLSHSSLACAV